MVALGWFPVDAMRKLVDSDTASWFDKALAIGSGVYDIIPGDDTKEKAGNTADWAGVYIPPDTPMSGDETKSFFGDLLKR
jgi:hypothetical protein